MDKYLFPHITNAAFNMSGYTEETRCTVLEEYSKSNKEEVYAYAKERKILPFAAYLLNELGCDSEFWLPVVEKYEARNSLIIAQMDKAFQKLKDAGVKTVFVAQNFGAVLMGGKSLSLFASGDADLCGDISEKDLINRTFSELGYQRKDRYCGNKLLSSDFSNDKILPDGFYLGIEYDTISRLKLPNPIDMNDFVDWDHMMHYQDTSIVLPPVDAQTYICLVHISLHSFSRAPDIRLYIDIQNCMNCHPDMNRVLEYAEHDRTVVRVVSAYLLTSKLFRLNWHDPAVEKAYAKYRSRVDHMISRVYNEEKNELIYEPGKVETLKIECDYYDSASDKYGILLPDHNWMREVYGSSGVMAHLKHAVRVVL